MRLALQRESEPLWFSVIAAPERVGRWIMDFGFGTLVERFEERLGRRVTGALIWLAAFAAFVLCVSTIVNEGVVPLIAFIRGVSTETTLGLISGFLWGFAIAVVSALVFVVVVRALVWRFTRTMMEESAKHVAKASEFLKEADEAVKRADAYTKQLEDRLDRMIAEAEDSAAATRSVRELASGHTGLFAQAMCFVVGHTPPREKPCG